MIIIPLCVKSNFKVSILIYKLVNINDKYHMNFFYSCRMDMKDSKPTFIQLDGCTYIFWWEHYLACPNNSSHLITQDSCMVTDEKSGHVFDLRPLKNIQKGLHTFDALGNDFFIGICNSPQNGNTYLNLMFHS